MNTEAPLEKLANRAIDIIRSTRSMSFPHWGNVEIAANKGSATDVVTKIDFAIEEYLAKQFSAVDQTIGFVGEEYGGDRTASRHWLVDPIDGTAHFVRGIPFCTTMVALVDGGQVVFSAIYDFVSDIMYHAIRGGGAFRNDERISVSDRDIENAYMFYESNLGKGDNLTTFLEFKKQAKVLNTYNAGFEFTLIASGKIEGRVCVDPYGKDFDFAPGTLLVSEAGGVVKNIGSNAFDYRNLSFIAANPLVYEALTVGEGALFPTKD